MKYLKYINDIEYILSVNENNDIDKKIDNQTQLFTLCFQYLDDQTYSIAKKLIEDGADVNTDNGYWYLFGIVIGNIFDDFGSENNMKILKMLLDRNVNLLLSKYSKKTDLLNFLKHEKFNKNYQDVISLLEKYDYFNKLYKEREINRFKI